MGIREVCESLKERVAAELAGAQTPADRSAVLIQGLYAFSTEVAPTLGSLGRSQEYLKRQEAALDLVSFLALPLIQCGDRRGVAVLVEVGEGCADPLVKKKLEVYAQELLAKSAAAAAAPRSRKLGTVFLVAGAVLAATGVVLVLARSPERNAPPTVYPELPALPATTFEAPAVPVAPRARSAVTSREPEERKTVAAEEPERTPAAAPVASTTKVRIVNDQILVPVTLKNGSESMTIELVLETGATRTALYDGVAARLKIDLRNSRASRAELADGRIVGAILARIDQVSVGPYAHSGFELELFPYNGGEAAHGGLLGMDFLGKHRYQIDMENSLIHWH